MKFYLCSLIVVLSIIGSFCQNIDFSYYHKSEQMDELLQNLITSCKTGDVKVTNATQILPDAGDQFSLLKYYDITGKNKTDSPKQNVFLLSGEHPRELIASEVLFNFVLQLCNPNQKQNEKFTNLLNVFNFRIIVNSNPNGRQLVEQGQFCKRSNLNNVDINRNWDIHWAKASTFSSEENPGSKPFSEIETKFVMLAVKEFKPKLFLTIHSGVYGLFIPYAYLQKEGSLNIENMKQVSNEIKNKYCSSCDVGPPSVLIGYKSAGTCLDYIYDNYKVPYALAWEIYTNEKPLVEMEKAVKNSNNTIGLPEISKEMKKISKSLKKSSFLKISESDKLVEDSSFSFSNNLRSSLKIKRTYSTFETDICLNLFNPLDKMRYDFLVNNWIKAILYLLDYVKRN